MIELSRGLTEVQIQYVMKEILKAICFLHEKNVIHRDLKAGNVLLTNDAKVKLGLRFKDFSFEISFHSIF